MWLYWGIYTLLIFFERCLHFSHKKSNLFAHVFSLLPEPEPEKSIQRWQCLCGQQRNDGFAVRSYQESGECEPFSVVAALRRNSPNTDVRSDCVQYFRKNVCLITEIVFTCSVICYNIYSLFFIRILFFWPRLYILIFLLILGWKYSCIILQLVACSGAF